MAFKPQMSGCSTTAPLLRVLSGPKFLRGKQKEALDKWAVLSVLKALCHDIRAACYYSLPNSGTIGNYDFMRIDFARIDLMEVDLVRIDLMGAPSKQ